MVFDTLTEEEIREETLDIFMEDLNSEELPEEKRITNWNTGGFWRKVAETVARNRYLIHKWLEEHLPQAFIDTATGLWLDLWVLFLGLVRRKATFAAGKVIFARKNGYAGAVTINKGTQVSTKALFGLRAVVFETTADAVLPAIDDLVEVPVKCLLEGTQGNVGIDTITKLVTSLPGIGAVSNNDNWLTTPARDDETDNELRRRFKLKLAELSETTTKLKYYSWLYDVDGVTDAYVDQQHPRGQGTVDCYFWTTAGAPNAEFVEEVSDIIIDKARDIDNVAVYSATPKHVSLNLKAYYDYDTIEDFPAFEQKVKDVIGSQFHRGGLFVPVATYTVNNKYRIGENFYMMRAMNTLAAKVPELLSAEPIDLDDWVIVTGIGEIVVFDGVTIEWARIEDAV